MQPEALRRARQREYSTTYRDNKRDRRSPERRDVAEAIATVVMERGNARMQAFVVRRLSKAGFDPRESEKVCDRLFRDAAIARSDREILRDH